MNYRHEIDGLRAVAVIPVILFHAGFEVFSGGFVGVDVFFVISGYLITGILIKSLDDGKFSIVQFYENRARRILPALFVVMTLCVPFAWMWMLPSQFKDFAQSLIAVVFFVSNVLFWREEGYFAASAELNPLLHTWSLAVEEQYYLLFPLFLLLTWRFGRNRLFWAIVIIAAISLLICEWGWRNEPHANFYLAPTRAWELLAGSICAFLAAGRAYRSNNALSTAGLSLIVFAILHFDSTTPFPSLYALAPVGGTSLILLFAGNGTWVARLLSMRGFVGIGLISYSTYLWHQPLFAFARIRAIAPPTEWMMLLLATASLGLAYLTWRFVEQPFRKRAGPPLLPSRRSIFAASATFGALFVALGIYGHLSQGAEWRFAFARSFLNHFDNEPPARQFFIRTNMYSAYRDECNFYMHGEFEGQAKSEIPKSCYIRNSNAEKVIFLWGDSHAQMYYFGLKEVLPSDWQILQVASSACAPSLEPERSRSLSCRKSNTLALAAIRESKPNVVVLSQADQWKLAELKRIISSLKNMGVGRILVMGPSPRWSTELPWIMVRNWGKIPVRTWQGIDPGSFAYDKGMKAALAQLEESGVEYVSVLSSLCNQEGCLTYIGDNNFQDGITSWDYGHLTPIASEFVARSALEDAILGNEDDLGASRYFEDHQ